MQRNSSKFETFNDGIAYIYQIKDISKPGDRPCLKPVLYRKHSFEYRTIGVRRNYEAMQAEVRLDEMIKIHLDRGVSSQDVVVIDGIQYSVVQVQHKTNTLPGTSLVTLQRREEYYAGL